jgi:hypothetical protein
MPGKLPSPRVQSFVVCEAIYEDRRTQKCILVGPFGGLALNFFPAGFRLSLYADLCGGHGTYQLALESRDEDLEAVWKWQWPEPTRYEDPLYPRHVILHDAVLEFPRPGRYDLVLLANGEDVSHHGLEVVLRPAG